MPTRIAAGRLTLNAGWDYAFYVHLASYDRGHRLRFSEGTRSRENDDLTIFAGVAKGPRAFGEETIADRQWNGTIHYTPVPWDDLGHGLGGPSGLPVLTGSGSLLPGTGAKILLTNAPSRALAFLIIGFSTWYEPFNGGTLVPALDLYMPLRTDSSGSLRLEGEWPADLVQGTPIYLQYGIPGDVDWLASNALQATAQ